MFNTDDSEFPGTMNNGKTSYTGVAKNGRMSWRILTDCYVVPEIKATSAGADVSNLFNVEFLGIAHSSNSAGNASRGVKAEWKVSVTDLQDRTDIEFTVSDPVLKATGNMSATLDTDYNKMWSELRGLDKEVYDKLEWMEGDIGNTGLGSVVNGTLYDGLRVGDMLNGAYAVILKDGAKPHMTTGEDEGDTFQFIVLVKNGFRIKDCFMLNDQLFNVGDIHVAYEYNNVEYTFIPDGYHAAVITAKANTPIDNTKGLVGDHIMILTAEIDR